MKDKNSYSYDEFCAKVFGRPQDFYDMDYPSNEYPWGVYTKRDHVGMRGGFKHKRDAIHWKTHAAFGYYADCVVLPKTGSTAAFREERDKSSAMLRHYGTADSPCVWMSIAHPRKGFADRPTKPLGFISWKLACKIAKKIAIRDKTKVRLATSSGYDNQGYYFQ